MGVLSTYSHLKGFRYMRSTTYDNIADYAGYASGRETGERIANLLGRGELMAMVEPTAQLMEPATETPEHRAQLCGLLVRFGEALARHLGASVERPGPGGTAAA